ncbi:MAG: DUF2493 domain-containing protein [Mailhella sp.]|nr:DUF2493 domain-containing protein [Mailhella sp.]
MKLAVIGSRTFQNYEWLEQCLLQSFLISEIESVISGGARGADALAVRFARKFGLPLEIVNADWETHGRKAGPLRNTEIVRRADAVAAFWDGHSRGTRDSIAKARMAGKRIVIFPCTPRNASSPELAGRQNELPATLLLHDRDRMRQMSLFPEETDE